MERRSLRSNYLLSIGKLILFLILLCFAVKFTQTFMQELKTCEDFDTSVFYFSILFPFLFYTFVGDLNNVYYKVQKFFFRSDFFSLVFPSLLVISAISFFIFPKLFNFSFDKRFFILTGGIFFIIHLIFVARNIKSSSFVGFSGYLLNFTLIYLLTLLLLVVYFNINFKLSFGEIIQTGTKKGVILLKQISSQLFVKE